MAATEDWLRDSGLTKIEPDSALSVTVPGAIDAWDRLLAKHGTISLGEALGPAIGLAEEGVPVTPRVAWDWQSEVEKLRGDPGAKKHYLKDGQAPKTGDVMRYPALARTFRAIAKGGRDVFHQG
jgi:gamma-glutamyltranspeptidase/glutathione hydrolase